MKQVRERGAESGFQAAPADTVKAKKKEEPIYVVECEPHELPIFREQSATMIPAHNKRKDCIARLLSSDEIRSTFSGSEWYGGITKWDEAYALVRDGWAEGGERAIALAAELRGALPDPESARRIPCWAEDGDELDRDRLYGGNIDRPWRATSRVTRRGPRTLKIVGKWSVNCGVSAEQMAWNGATLIALADLLENAGYACELVLAGPCKMHPTSAPHSKTMPIVRLKAAYEPLNPSALAGVACHVGVYRTYGFLMDASSDTQIDDALGYPVDVRPVWEEAQKAGMVEEAEAFVEQALDKRSAIERIKEVLGQLFPEMDLEAAGTASPRAFGEV